MEKSTLPDATELESKIGSSWEAKQEGDFKLQKRFTSKASITLNKRTNKKGN